MKTFKEFVRELLKNDVVLSDEYICSLYIKKRYGFMFATFDNISVIGKSYESHRKLLWKYRRDMVEETHREVREN